jgi:capsular polysaccharide biosynthesis protein
MDVVLFKQFGKYKNVFLEDANGRVIDIYKYDNCRVTGINLYYPNCLLYSGNKLYVPHLERTMSLNVPSTYKSNQMKFEPEIIDNVNYLPGDYFWFVYNTDNYFHFLYDSIPYIISYIELKKDIPHLKLLMQYPNPQKTQHYRFILELLELLHIYDDDIVMINKFNEYENVYVSTSYTHDGKSNSPPRKEIYALFKLMTLDILLTDTPKKIYISRRSHLHGDLTNIGTNYTQRRKLINEDDLVKHLVGKGYVEIFTETMTTKEKITYFVNASHIVGCIGGGIANVLFSKPDTILHAIISPGFLDVNSRFTYSLNCVNVKYNYNTRHIENTLFKKYMRVKSGNIIGEIIKVNERSVVVQYTDVSTTGWNNDSIYKTIELLNENVIKLDDGLNSYFILDI